MAPHLPLATRGRAWPAWLVAATLVMSALGAQAQTLLRLDTSQGLVDLRLLDAEAPRTVANFLSYVRSGAYSDTLVHRSVPGFVVQGGGYRYGATGNVAPHIPTNAPVANEFSSARSNLRGTVAMAKTSASPDTATSEWFVNLANNASNLDNQNGGFTVFARVTTPGMQVVDRIAALPRVNASNVVGGAFDNMPVATSAVTVNNIREQSVVVRRVLELGSVATLSDADRVLNYLEAAYPQYLQAAASASGTWEGYTYRHYAERNAYVGVKDGKVYYLVPALSADISELGSLPDWLATASAAGY